MSHRDASPQFGVVLDVVNPAGGEEVFAVEASAKQKSLALFWVRIAPSSSRSRVAVPHSSQTPSIHLLAQTYSRLALCSIFVISLMMASLSSGTLSHRLKA